MGLTSLIPVIVIGKKHKKRYYARRKLKDVDNLLSTLNLTKRTINAHAELNQTTFVTLYVGHAL